MSKRLVLGVLAALLFAGCYGDPQSLTDDGKGYPELTLEFPESTSPGSTETATLVIHNPGPGDMDSLVVAFSRLGDPKLPPPIVDVIARDQEGSVKNVTPEPNAVSTDGIIYTFDGIAEDESKTVTFTLLLPQTPGPVGNAILVYPGEDPDRSRGVRLETEVGG